MVKENDLKLFGVSIRDGCNSNLANTTEMKLKLFRISTKYGCDSHLADTTEMNF